MVKEENEGFVNNYIIESPLDLLHKLAIAEEKYRKEDLEYDKEYNKLLLNIDWDKINKDRVEKKLSKLSNQDMKKAYIEDKLELLNHDLVMSKLEYNRLLRMYEMMKKYSLDVLR